MSVPSDQQVMEYLTAYAARVQIARKFPRWSRDEIIAECWLIWAGLVEKYGDELDARWRGLAKQAFNCRLPDRYQRSLGKKIRRTPGHGRTYHTDQELGYRTPARTEVPEVIDPVIPSILRAMKSLEDFVRLLG